MSGGDVVRLGDHGGAVVAAVGAALAHVREGQDEKFVCAIREVGDTIMLCIAKF